MSSDSSEDWDDTEETEIEIPETGLDWTGSFTLDSDYLNWIAAQELPSNVDGVDYSRAVSPVDGDWGGQPNV